MGGNGEQIRKALYPGGYSNDDYIYYILIVIPLCSLPLK